MWLLTFLPNWIFHLILLTGILGLIASFVLSFIPFISTYKLPLQVGALLLTLTGVWFEGGISNDTDWKMRVAEMEKKVAVAEVKSAEANTAIVTKVITKIQKVKEVVYVNKEIIKEVVAKQLDVQCTIPVSAISVHNSASQNEVSSGPSSINGAASTVKASTLLSTVTENYGTYYEIAEKLKGWQTWYTDQKKIFEDSQK